MSKEQKSNKETKKKPAMTPKEKKAAKKAPRGTSGTSEALSGNRMNFLPKEPSEVHGSNYTS